MRTRDWINWEESDLVALARDGNLPAFDELVFRYRPASIVIARQILASRELAEDAVQDALLAAFKSLPQLTDLSRFAPWLGSIVRNRCRRLAASEKASPLPIDEMILRRLPALAGPIEDRLDEQEARSKISELPAELGTVLELYYLEHWSVKSIGEFTHLPETTIKWRLHTGRKLLKKKLCHLMEEWNER